MRSTRTPSGAGPRRRDESALVPPGAGAGSKHERPYRASWQTPAGVGRGRAGRAWAWGHGPVSGANRSPTDSTPFEHIPRNETKPLSPTAFPHPHLVPRQRRRDARQGERPERVGSDRGLGGVVLAPVDEHLALSKVASHVRQDLAGVLPFHPAGNLVGLGVSLLPRPRWVEPRVQLHPLRAAGLRVRLQPAPLELVAEPERHDATLDDRRRRTRVQIEDHQVDRTVVAVGDRAPHRHVQLERGKVGDPHKGWKIVQH